MICFLCSKIKKNDGSLPLKLTETYLFCTWGMILENHFFQVSTEWCSIGHGHKAHLIFRRTSTCYTLQCLKQFFLQKVFWVSNNVSVGWQFKLNDLVKEIRNYPLKISFPWVSNTIDNFWRYVESKTLRIKGLFFWYQEKGTGPLI